MPTTSESNERCKTTNERPATYDVIRRHAHSQAELVQAVDRGIVDARVVVQMIVLIQ